MNNSLTLTQELMQKFLALIGSTINMFRAAGLEQQSLIRQRQFNAANSPTPQTPKSTRPYEMQIVHNANGGR
jgi:hypothetical protein